MFFGNTLLAILHLEIAKKLFAAGSAEQLNSPQCFLNLFQCRHLTIHQIIYAQVVPHITARNTVINDNCILRQ